MEKQINKSLFCHRRKNRNQYMLGDSLLVAPIFNEDSMAEYYLPEGICIGRESERKSTQALFFAAKKN